MAEDQVPAPEAADEEPGDWDRLQQMLDAHHERTVKSVIEHFSKQEPKKDDQPAKATADEPKGDKPEDARKDAPKRHAGRRLDFLYGRR